MSPASASKGQLARLLRELKEERKAHAYAVPFDPRHLSRHADAIAANHTSLGAALDHFDGFLDQSMSALDREA